MSRDGQRPPESIILPDDWASDKRSALLAASRTRRYATPLRGRIPLIAVLVGLVGVLATGCGISAAVSDTTCREAQAQSAKDALLARAILNELVSLRAARLSEGAGNASASQDRAQEALISAGYQAVLKPIEETCDSAGPESKPYQGTLNRMAEELGLPTPPS